MARKNVKLSESCGRNLDLVFNQRTRSVMAPDTNPDTIKEKLAAVREVVPNHSNHEITLVLVHFDHNVEQTIQAFLDNGAKDVLQEWQSTAGSNKPSGKKKKKKTQDKDQPPGGSVNSGTSSSTTGQQPVLPRQHTSTTGQQPALPQQQTSTTGQQPVLPRQHTSTTGQQPALPQQQTSTTEQQPALPRQQTQSHKQEDSPTSVICEKQSPVMGTVPTPVESNIIPTNHITADTLTSKTHPGPGRTEEYPAALRVDKPPRSNKLDSHKPDNADMTKSKTSEIVESKSSLSNSVGRKPLVFRNSNINNTRHVGKASGQRVESSHKSGTSAAPKEPVQHTNRQRPANLHVTSVSRDRKASSARERTVSETSTTSTSSRKPHGGLEKSLKDLQRQTVSLQRQKLTMKEEMDRSMKQISHNFTIARKELNEREACLMYELTKVKTETQDLLDNRQQLAADLRCKLDQAPSMNELELLNLRADIKHFVSERKIDEDLGSMKRYVCDQEALIQQLKAYGEVVPVKATYSTRRPSITSIASSVLSPDDLLSPLSPRTPLSASPLTATPQSANPLAANPLAANTSSTPQEPGVIQAKSVTKPVAQTTRSDKPTSAPQPVAVSLAGAKVISQSESLTQYELSKPHSEVDKSSNFRGPRFSQGQRRGQGQRGQSQDLRGLNHKTGDQGQLNRGQEQRGQSQDHRGHNYKTGDQGQLNRGQEQRGQSQDHRGHNYKTGDQGQLNRGQEQRGQSQDHRGHNYKTAEQGQLNKGYSQMNKGQGQINRSQGQTSRGQGPISSGKSETNGGQGTMLNDPAQDSTEFGDDLKKSRSARRRQKQREKQRELKTQDQQNPDTITTGADGKHEAVNCEATDPDTITTGADGKHEAVNREATDPAVKQNTTNAPVAMKRRDPQQNRQSQSPQKRNQESRPLDQGQGHSAVHDVPDQRRQRNRRQRTRSRGEVVTEGEGHQDKESVVDDKQIVSVTADTPEVSTDKKLSGQTLSDSADGDNINIAVTEATRNIDTLSSIQAGDPAGVDITQVEPAASEVNQVEPAASEVTQVEPLEPIITQIKPAKSEVTQVKPAESEVTQVEPLEPIITQVEPAEPEVTRVEPAHRDTSVDMTTIQSANTVCDLASDKNDVRLSTENLNCVEEEEEAVVTCLSESEPTDNGIVLTDNGTVPTDNGIVPTDNGIVPTDNGIVPSTRDVVISQKSVTVSVKETTEKQYSKKVVSHQGYVMPSAADDLINDRLIDINANDHSKITSVNGAITNGAVARSPIKTAIVSIEKFKEVTTKATISVENLNSAEDALPQRKVRARRRDKDNSVDDDDLNERSANGVCPSDDSQYQVINGNMNGHN